MAIRLTGGAQNIAHGDIAALDGAGAFTWMCYFRRVGPGDMVNDAFATLKKGANTYLYHSSNGTPNGVATYDGSGGETRITAASILTTSYRHVCGAYAGGGATPRFVIDGSEAAITGAGQTYTNVAAEVLQWIGNANTAYDLAHFKFYSAELTLAEIVREMMSYRPARTANLFLWSPYDDGTSARDYSGNGNHGTVTGGTVIDGPNLGIGAPLLVL